MYSKIFKSRRFFFKIIFLVLVIPVFIFLKNWFGFDSNFIREYTDEFISLDKRDYELFSKINTNYGSTKIKNLTIEDHKNNRVVFIESFLYSETEIKVVAFAED